MKGLNNIGINNRQQLAYLLIFLLLGYLHADVFSQNSNRPSRQSSIEAFSDGKYEEAYKQFSELLLLYPRDPLYKYYSGVCLVQLNKDPESATFLLQEALKGAAAVRSLPSDAVFFLGRAQQMSGRFSDAIESYRKYEDQSGRKTAREMGVAGFIQQCLNKQGQLVETVAEKETDPPAVVIKTQTGQSVANAGSGKIAPLASTAAVKEPLPAGYEKILNEALDLQHKADSSRELASLKKQNIENVPATNREAERKLISELESLAASYQRQSDQKFNQATILKSGGTITGNVMIAEKKGGVVSYDTIKTATIKIKPRDNGVFSVFEVLQKPVFNANEKIQVDPDVPDGLVYRIQMAVFRNPVTPSVFKGITPVYGFRITSNGLTYYYAGMFRRSADASRALVAVKSKGFKDSFIVPFSGKKPVSAERAASLEKEWGRVPLFKEEKSAGTVADTLPPTLIFRVEVASSKKPLDEKKTDELRKVAGNRGLDVFKTEDDSTVYLIGKFITFESAAEYNDILIRNGYRDSKVVSWIGKKEIPVETARKLFEKLE